MWLRRRMESIRWEYRVSNEEVLSRVDEERQIINKNTKEETEFVGRRNEKRVFLEDGHIRNAGEEKEKF